LTDNTDNGKRDTLVSRRLSLRAWLWDTDPSRPLRAPEFQLRVASCGRKRIAGFVSVKAGGGTSSLGGLSTCGSVWVCPVCSPKIAATRSAEVMNTIRAWQNRQGSVVLVTLTLSHGRHHSLAETWDALGKGWASVRNGKPWKADVAEFGIEGYCRVVEVTHSQRNGWHPHAHVLLFVTGTPTDADCERLRERIYGRWSRRLVKEGFKTLDFDRHGKAVGVDVRRADAHTVEYLGEYLAKFGYNPKGDATGLALEVSRGDLKTGRKGSRTPWELAELARSGDRRALALWQEWERTSLGRRQYAWAHGFRESLDLDAVLTDQEAAEAEEAAHVTVAQLPGTSWAKLVAELRLRARKGLPGSTMADMLAAAARWDAETFRAWLDGHGITHTETHVPRVFAPLPVDPMEADPFVIRTARRHRANYERLRQEADSWRSRDRQAG
jgi:hypothetical protein